MIGVGKGTLPGKRERKKFVKVINYYVLGVPRLSCFSMMETLRRQSVHWDPPQGRLLDRLLGSRTEIVTERGSMKHVRHLKMSKIKDAIPGRNRETQSMGLLLLQTLYSSRVTR